MSAPNWLPPLNSHDDYSTEVILEHQNPIPSDFPKGSHFCIDVSASVEFFSESSVTVFKGLDMRGSVLIPTSTKKDSIFSMLSEIPFKLDHIVLKRKSLEVNLPLFVLHDEESLVQKIWAFLIRLSLNTPNSNPNNILPVKLEIRKGVQISDEEHNIWTSWYDEKKRADPDFERDYFAAISRTRTDEELWYELDCLQFRAATESSIQGLERIKLEEYCCSSSESSELNCLVCLEDLGSGGSVLIRLPCSHIFHRECIVKWLQESHLCPLCRFMLPSH